MFGFPVAQRTDDFVLRQNLLKTVVFQVRFPSVPDISARFAEFQDLLVDTFPIAQERKKQNFAIQFVDKTPIVSPVGSTDVNNLVLISQSGQSTFSIKEDELTLTIVGNEYVNFKHTQGVLDKSVYRIGEALRLTNLSRISIRKINILAIPTELSLSLGVFYKALYHNLLTVTGTSLPASAFLYSGVSNYRFINDPYRLDLVYGITPEPGPDKSREFILDIDILNTSEENSFSNLNAVFQTINDELFNVFNWSINPELLEIINKNIDSSPT
ncbi:TIGR04255 family protein [Hymenobacter sp. BT559]|uniref:TIGR04255 family protein n=1 Tax=Hymenobacter sp. BT559 TaxID=2795729 RepID=UPI0018EBAD91|nr:TIGR04255 family protein [Hymenobacter sp. BT559]MBJ6145842.1 TIGR04255 family protein [Hymenobacter sp. BT559]